MLRRAAVAVVGLLGAASAVSAQDIAALRRDLERWDDFALESTNRVAAFRTHDISLFFAPRDPFLGFRGAGYDRLRVYFHRIARDGANPLVYHVQGRTDFAGRVRTFEGTIRIVQVLAIPPERSEMAAHPDAGFRINAFSFGEYEFREDSAVAGWGVYSGATAVSWVQDRRGLLHRDDFLNEERDGVRNNLFLGVWRARGAGAAVPTAWGERRVPGAGDLDIGAAYFGVNPKYLSRGWQDIEKSNGVPRVP